jgi:hypothetical protein
MTEDPWDYVHITTWNLLPFVLRRVGAAPGWVVRLCFSVWIAGVAALAWVLLRLHQILGAGEFNTDASIAATACVRPKIRIR